MGILGQEEAGMDAHICLGIDLQDAIAHDFDLLLSHCFHSGDDLAVHVGQAHLIVVDQVEGAYAAAGQRLAYVAAHTAHTEHRNTAFGQLGHGIASQQQLGTGELVEHGSSLSSAFCQYGHGAT